MQTNFIAFISIISWVFLLLLALKVVFFLVLSSRHYKKEKKSSYQNYNNFKASVVVPCFNEEVTLSNCIKSLLKQTYKNFEILIIDDGSTDNSFNIAEKFKAEYPNLIKLFKKENGGKANALNFGIEKSDGDIIVCLDADSIFMPNSLKVLMGCFSDKNIAAVGGNVKVSNRNRILGLHQEVEYISGLNIQRRSFAQINCIQIISGAIGAFRKDKLLEVGGYSTDTIVEDMDITIAFAKAGFKIHFMGDAIAYTEAPEKVSDFIKQRQRWIYGGFQVLAKYKKIIFRKKYGSIGMIGLPYFLIFPWVDVTVTILFLLAIIRTIILGNILDLLLFYFGMALVQFLILSYALHLDRERKHIALIALYDSLWYSHLISFVTIKAGISYLFRKEVKWNKAKRQGKNVLPCRTKSETGIA